MRAGAKLEFRDIKPVPYQTRAPNPAAVALGIKDIKDSVQRRQSFGWLYFLMDLTAVEM